VDEVHQCTYDLGQLAAEVARLRSEVAEIRGIGVRTLEAVQRAGESMKATADDSASHKVSDLRAQLLEEQRDSYRAKARDDRNNRVLILIAIAGPVLAALITHLAHVLSK
jgi:hypothetical protein